MTHRRFGGGPLVIASHNAGKVGEMAELLAPFGADVRSAGALALADVEETGTTFAANAELKALAAARATGQPALADDSGLCVSALEGAPGIFSARWGGESRDFTVAMERVQRELGDIPDRRAYFICVLCLAWPDGHVETVEGTISGTLTWPPRGSNGFGYDPMFVAEGEQLTFGEMEPAKKHAMSHRARAFALMAETCFKT